MDAGRATRLLVVLGGPGTARGTADHALAEARDATYQFDADVMVEFLVPEGARDALADALADRPTEARNRVVVERTPLGDRGPDGVAAYAVDRDAGRVVVAADADEAVADALLARLGDAAVERAPRRRSGRRGRLVAPGSPARTLAVFGLSMGFYVLVLGDLSAFDLATGAASAAVVAAVLSRVTFPGGVDARSAGRLLRSLPFLAYLGWEIARANLAVAYVVLHPSLPVDPAMEDLPTETESRLERAVLANAVTLTPGSLTVEAGRETFRVHTLTAASREGLRAGGLQRAVAWIFGRSPDGDWGRDGTGEDGDGTGAPAPDGGTRRDRAGATGGVDR
jgi:multisubunit Na+/H+ antiporter MnhE subunit